MDIDIVILYKYRIEIEIWISNRHYLLPVFFFRTVFFCFFNISFLLCFCGYYHKLFCSDNSTVPWCCSFVELCSLWCYWGANVLRNILGWGVVAIVVVVVVVVAIVLALLVVVLLVVGVVVTVVV